MVYLGAGLAVLAGANIRVTYFVDLMSPRARDIIELVMRVMVVVLLALLAWRSIPVIQLALRSSLQATGWSTALVRLPLPLGCLLIGYYQVGAAISTWRRLRDGARS